MNRHLATIPGARGRRPVRVERKIRMGGPSPGRGAPPCRQPEPPICHSRLVGYQPREATGAENRAGLSTGAARDLIGPISSKRFTLGKPSSRSELAPISSTKTAGGFTVASGLPGALADDVCRHIWSERGRFAPILYGSM